jgi:hypothetical protein
METLNEALAALRRDPTRPVRARIDDLTVELRAIPDARADQSAAELFQEIGPWEGETTEELSALFEQARRAGGNRRVDDL